MSRRNKTNGTNETKAGIILLSAFVLTLISAALPAHAQDALFLGLTDIRGEPTQPRFEQAIRQELAASPRIRLVSDVETRRVIGEMERRGRGRAETFIPPGARVGDSVVVFRGVVEEAALTVKRRALAWGRIDARVTVHFYFNELAGPAVDKGEFSEKTLTRNDLLNSGSTLKLTFGATASKTKDLLLFADPKKTVHVSASDRSELMGKTQAKIIKDFSAFASHYFNALAVGPVHRGAVEAEEPEAEEPEAVRPEAPKE